MLITQFDSNNWIGILIITQIVNIDSKLRL